MKKFLYVIAFVLVASLVIAAGERSVEEGNTGIPSPRAIENIQASHDVEVIPQIAIVRNTELRNDSEETPKIITTTVQSRINNGEYVSEEGKKVQIQERENNRSELKSGETIARTAMEMHQEKSENRTSLRVKLADGNYSEVKIMPDTASATALERLRLKVCSSENNCTIELKETGTGNATKVTYEVQAKKETKLLGLFKTRMQVQAQVDAQTGEIMESKRPWWSFLASNKAE